jgi:flavin reductase (DIM6/NTAB) family NADH-FMN oxidoreductase RutF
MDSELDKYAAETLRMLDDPGLLLVTCGKNGKPNVMTIGWGFIGVFWRMPVFVVAVRHSRFTHEVLEENGEFTVNVPTKDMEKIVQHCGEVSGRRHDKVSECKLSPIEGRKVKVPVLAECNIHYECRVVHKLDVNPDLIPDEWKSLYTDRNYHTLYFGQILEIY